MNINLNVTYYYIVNMDLKMSKGKIAAQVSHVAMMLGKRHGVIGRAIILKSNVRTMIKLIGLLDVEYQQDAGLTEVPKGSLTCVGFKKGKNYQSKIATKLKLL